MHFISIPEGPIDTKVIDRNSCGYHPISIPEGPIDTQ